MLSNEDVDVPRPKPTAFLADIRKDPIRGHATLFGWIACFAQSAEFSTFAFYIPVLFVMVGVSDVLGTNLVTFALYIIVTISGWTAPLVTPRALANAISASPGFTIVLVAAAGALFTRHVQRASVRRRNAPHSAMPVPELWHCVVGMQPDNGHPRVKMARSLSRLACFYRP
jgi:hypothetical protein